MLGLNFQRRRNSSFIDGVGDDAWVIAQRDRSARWPACALRRMSMSMRLTPSSSERACAGAATALLLARAGARVLLVDKGVYGTDTLSTHALMRGAVLQLHRWGVLPAIVAAGTPPVHSTTFSYREQDITVPIEPRFGVSALYAPRRALLDRTLVDAAADSGAEVSYGVQCRRCDHRRSRARARDHGCCGRHASPHRSRHRHRRRRTALDDRTARWCGPRCRGPALDRSPLQLLGRVTRGRLLLAVPDGCEYRRHSHQQRCHMCVRVGAVADAFAPRFAVTPLRHTVG